MNNQISGSGGEGLGGPDLGDAAHVDIEGLLAYAHGETAGPEADGVLRHSRACRECGDELAVMLALVGTQVAAVAEDESEVPPALRRWMAPVAASVVLAVLRGVALRSGWSPLTAPPDQDIVRLATTEAPDRLMLDFLFAPSSAIANLDRARSGFELIVEGRYDSAVAQLSARYAAQPGNGEVAASLGIALYLADDESDRVEVLLAQGRALRLQDFSRLAGWYLANHYLRRGEVVQARAVLEGLSQWADTPGTQARELLERLRTEFR